VPRAVYPSSTALATEYEVQQYVWRDSANHTEEEQDLLCMILNGVSDAIDACLGGVMRRLYTERYDGGAEWVTLRHRPVIAVNAVRELGVLLQADRDYAVYREQARLRRLPAVWPPAYPAPVLFQRARWASYPQAIEVEYEAGWAQQERDPATGALTAVVYEPGGEGIRQAALIWCYALWSAGPASFSYLVTEAGIVRAEGMPPQVWRLLVPYLQPVVAVAP